MVYGEISSFGLGLNPHIYEADVSMDVYGEIAMAAMVKCRSRSQEIERVYWLGRRIGGAQLW
jgi:hypothetical protein